MDYMLIFSDFPKMYGVGGAVGVVVFPADFDDGVTTTV
jgi:hypothetical protein